MMVTKICCSCKIEKVLAEFDVARSRKDGHRGQCKACRSTAIKKRREADPERYREHSRKWRRENQERARAQGRARYQANKEKIKNQRACRRQERLTEIHARDRTYYHATRDARLEAMKRYRNKQRIDPAYLAGKVEEVRLWRAKYPERAKRKAKHDKVRRRAMLLGCEGCHTETEWEEILKSSNYKCLSCNTGNNITKDHIIPLSIGGTDFIDNLQPLCRSCNAKKALRYIDYRHNAYWGDWT